MSGAQDISPAARLVILIVGIIGAVSVVGAVLLVQLDQATLAEVNGSFLADLPVLVVGGLLGLLGYTRATPAGRSRPTSRPVEGADTTPRPPQVTSASAPLRDYDG